MVKVKYIGDISPIVFTSAGVNPCIIKTDDTVELPKEVYDAELSNDHRWVLSGAIEAPAKKIKGVK